LKYAKEFKREVILKEISKRRIGIRASSPNEIWHIDITEFRMKNGRRIYLQVIMDNYSRKIIIGRLVHTKKEATSIKTLLQATEAITPQKLISDGGGENIAKRVQLLLLEKGIRSLIAKRDIFFSNSMVESFFNRLKNRFLVNITDVYFYVFTKNPER
jgi:transposase InsO family protein